MTNKGFTIIESMVAIFILMSVIIGTTRAIQIGIASNILSKEEITAFYLAQEGVEQIRSIRDNNGLEGIDWLEGIALAGDPCEFGETCRVDTVAAGSGLEPCSLGDDSCTVRQNATTGFYGHDSAWPLTPFKRSIELEQISSDEVGIDVLVTWSKGSVTRSFSIRENIFNWQGTGSSSPPPPPPTTPPTFVRSGGVQGTSFSMDIGSPGTDRLVVIVASNESNGTDLSGVFVDNDLCNLVARANNSDSVGNHTEMWYCDEDDLGASSGTVNIEIIGGGATWGTHSHLYTGASQSGPTDFGIDNTSVGSDTITVTSINTSADSLVIAGWANGSSGLTINSQTSPLITRQDGPHPASAGLFTSSGVEASAQTNKTYSVTMSGTFFRATGIVASWAPGSSSPPPPPPPANIPPVANAGTDQSITLPINSVELDGAGSSDLDGTIQSYVWNPNPLNPSAIDPDDEVSPNISGLLEGTYVFELVVTDDDGATDEDTVSVTVEPAGGGGSCIGTGSIRRDYWTGVGGTSVIDLTGDPDYPNNPSGSNLPTSFEAPTDWGDDYGTRMYGTLSVPTSGSYTFYIASDDGSELWLSTNSNPGSRVLIAQVDSWTDSREWNKFGSQESSPISLNANTQYYIEAIQKEGGGGDNLAVGWITPGSGSIDVIPGECLIPGAPSSPPPSSPPTFVRSDGVQGNSFNMDIGSPGTDRVVVVMASNEGLTGDVTGVSVDTKGCVAVESAQNSNGAGVHSEMWYCDEDNLGSSSGNVNISISTNGLGLVWAVHAHLYTGASQSGPADFGKNETTVNSNTITVSGITSSSDSMVVALWADGQGTHTVNSQTSPLILRQNGPPPESAGQFSSSGIESSAQSDKAYSVTFLTAPNRSTGIVATWAPAP